MTSIYIVRHGATSLNNQNDLSEDRIRGWTDVPLAPDGRKEAQAAGLKLKAKGIQAIVASSLSRAQETAAIIGQIVGVKPVTSEGLRPWNLGMFTGTATKAALPKIADYARNKPDEAVPGGESFAQFKQRAFAGLADAIEANQGKVLAIVTHHRNERLYEAWEAAGRPEDLSIDMGVFLQKGDPPGGIKTLAIGDAEQWKPTSGAQPLPDGRTGATGSGGKPSDGQKEPLQDGKAGTNGPGMSMQNSYDAPEGQKATKAEAHYGIAKAGSGDRCAACESFRPPNDCLKVEGRVAPAGWCELGHSKADGHAFYGDEEKGEAAPAESEVMPPVRPSTTKPPEMRPALPQAARAVPPAFAHGRAIAGAMALHAVGHITAKERDRHIGASQKVISKRKAFGSWAP